MRIARRGVVQYKSDRVTTVASDRCLLNGREPRELGGVETLRREMCTKPLTNDDPAKIEDCSVPTVDYSAWIDLAGQLANSGANPATAAAGVSGPGGCSSGRNGLSALTRCSIHSSAVQEAEGTIGTGRPHWVGGTLAPLEVEVQVPGRWMASDARDQPAPGNYGFERISLEVPPAAGT
jgi:hypothetical protein